MQLPEISALDLQAESVAARPGAAPVRGTQSLIQVISFCWRRPLLLALELAWRWSFGLPALALIGWLGWRLALRLPLDRIDLSEFSLQYPLAAAQWVAAAAGIVVPPLLRLAAWLAPLLMVLWAIASGVGRSFVLKRVGREIAALRMHSRTAILIWLQLLRVAALCATVAGWWIGLHWAANHTMGGAEPNLIGYFAWVICLSLGAFCLWAISSWIFSIAPLIAMLEGCGAAGSLRRSLRLGPLAGKLVEVNLSLGIVKLILVALAIVFSATPIPFTAAMRGLPLYLWCAGVTVVYLALSDFFQVARLAVFVRLWLAYHPKTEAPATVEAPAG